MKLPDGTTLMHALAPYDPAKAHEYYLRTRHLTGRKKSNTYTVNYGNKTVKLSAKELTEQRIYAAKRVENIKKNLAELNSKLHAAMRVAIKKKAKSKQEAAKPATTAEKSKVARDSKQYRDTHKQKIATAAKKSSSKTTSVKKKSSKSVDPVAELSHKIVVIRGSLKAAVARQRSLAGATRNG